MLRRRSAGGTALAAGGIAGGFRERFRVPSESLRVCAGAIRCSPGFVSEFRTIVSKASRNRFVAVPSVSFAGRTESPVCFGMRPRIAALQSRAGRDSSAARGPARGVRSAGCGRFCLRKGTRKVLRCGTAAETHEPAAKCGPPPRTAEKPREERAPHGGGGEPPALPGRQCRTFVRSRSHRSLLCAVADAVRKRPEHPSRQTAPCKHSLPTGIRHRRSGGRKTVRGADGHPQTAEKPREERAAAWGRRRTAGITRQAMPHIRPKQLAPFLPVRRSRCGPKATAGTSLSADRALQAFFADWHSAPPPRRTKNRERSGPPQKKRNPVSHPRENGLSVRQMFNRPNCKSYN